MKLKVIETSQKQKRDNDVRRKKWSLTILKEAEKAVIKENLWSIHPRNTTVDGKKSSSDEIR